MTFTTPPISILTTGVVTSPWACMIALSRSTIELQMTAMPNTCRIGVATATLVSL